MSASKDAHLDITLPLFEQPFDPDSTPGTAIKDLRENLELAGTPSHRARHWNEADLSDDFSHNVVQLRQSLLFSLLATSARSRKSHV